MFVRVVRFTGVSAERVQLVEDRVRANSGPPPGVNTKGLEVLFDEAQRTAVVLQRFATADDMREGARILEAMDPGETPGTRASVDSCEMRIEVSA